MSYTEAKERYAELGVDTQKAIDRLKKASLSLHCWQGDDVRGFDTDPDKPRAAFRRPETIRDAHARRKS